MRHDDEWALVLGRESAARSVDAAEFLLHVGGAWIDPDVERRAGQAWKILRRMSGADARVSRRDHEDLRYGFSRGKKREGQQRSRRGCTVCIGQCGRRKKGNVLGHR